MDWLVAQRKVVTNDGTRPDCFWRSQMNRSAKTDAQARACSKVTCRELRWRPVVPVGIQREIPVQLAPQFDVVPGVGVERKSPGSESAGSKLGSPILQGSEIAATARHPFPKIMARTQR